jgi:glyoxylase-like metal-dependent hydrolase (beta-lactamase superfamily II)
MFSAARYTGPMSRPIGQPGSGIAHPWPEPPKVGAIITVARGIKWLRMPLPFRLDHINLYLLEDGDAWTVVDAGIGLDRTRELWQGAFDAELDGKPIRRVLVTHFHPDHMGNARWLTERWGIDLWCTQAEWLMAQVAWQLGDDVGGRLDYYRQNGVGGREMSLIRERVGHYRQVVPAVPPRFRAVRDGDVMTVGERRWHVLAVYGHSPEQAIIHAPESRVLISGDQVLPKITTNVGVWPDQPLGNPLRLYLESLERFPGMAEDTLVLPAHGLPFHGLHARIERLRSHHEERLARALDATREPATAADVLPALFSRDLDGQQFGFAFGETLAHLHYLEWEDRVERLVDGGGLYRFRAR